MKLSHTLFFLSALFFYTLTINAQEPTAPANELDAKYAPNASSMFNTLVRKPGDSYANTEMDIDFKQCIKFYPFTLIRQKFYFSYEREIVKGLAIDAGIGKSFGNDVLQNYFLTHLSSFAENNVLIPEVALSNATYNGSWPLLSAGAKVYFSGNTFNEGFFEVNYRFEKTNYLLNPTISGNRIEGENDLVFTMNNFNVGFGYTGVSGMKSNFVHQFYMNFGVKLFNFTRYDQISRQKVNNTGTEIIYQKGAENLQVRIIPAFNIGYCLGFGF